MKKYFIIASLVCITVLAFVPLSHAASLTAIYDFSDQFDASATSFEGLDFTNDGTLWITSAPNFQAPQLFGVDLGTETVLSTTNYQAGWLDLLNPVGLASDGNNLFVASNRKWFLGDQPDYVYRDVNTATGQLSNAAVLSTSDCVEAEGAAYLNRFIYVSCEDTKNVVKLDPTTGAVVGNIDFGVSLLGLGATEDSLIVGDYTNHALLLYDVSAGVVTNTISLDDLFVGADSDYTALTGLAYEVTIANNGDVRHIPDPDGLAYRNGTIYMTFEHDLRVFEISLEDTPVPTPEPGTLLLIGFGLIGLAGFRKKHSS